LSFSVSLNQYDVYYWSFSGSGSCGLGPAYAVGITNLTFKGVGQLTTGTLDGTAYDITSFTGDIFELGGGFGYDLNITTAQANSGPFVFDPSQDLLTNGLVIPGNVVCSGDQCRVFPTFGTNVIGNSFGDFSFAETPFTLGAVPEPSTWAMLLIGFAGIGFAIRRKSQNHGPHATLVITPLPADAQVALRAFVPEEFAWA
jgi:PEP-CTERM motif